MNDGGDGEPHDLPSLEAALIDCRACPRLVAWREQVAVEKRAAYRDDAYWGRPVPGFGDEHAGLVVVGLAPAAHGANRTGRMFTGDRSGDWLYRALFRGGFANQALATDRDDGLELSGAWVTSPVKCAPPGNKPAVAERDACSSWFTAELAMLRRARAFLCLGGFAYRVMWRHLSGGGATLPHPRPAFGHGVEVVLEDGRRVFGSYHPSQQNTFTGRLTEEMLDAVVSRVRAFLDD
ncbi:MAG: uracil-DNA glycosylase [Acidimicrobiia bacterium]